FRDDARVKAGRKRQAIRFFGGSEGDCRRNDQSGGKRFHLPGLLLALPPFRDYYAKNGSPPPPDSLLQKAHRGALFVRCHCRNADRRQGNICRNPNRCARDVLDAEKSSFPTVAQKSERLAKVVVWLMSSTTCNRYRSIRGWLAMTAVISPLR